MIMKIKQWFAGMAYAVLGWIAFTCGFNIVGQFENMMNFTGKDFIESFAFFIVSIAGFVLMPYLLFHFVDRGIQDKWKNKPVDKPVEPVEKELCDEGA